MGGDKIQIFSSVQKFHRMLGVRPLNGKSVVFIICVAQLALTTLAFILISAQSADEFGFAFYACITGVQHFGHILIKRKKIENISELMESYDAFIDKSKPMADVSIFHKRIAMILFLHN